MAFHHGSCLLTLSVGLLFQPAMAQDVPPHRAQVRVISADRIAVAFEDLSGVRDPQSRGVYLYKIASCGMGPGWQPPPRIGAIYQASINRLGAITVDGLTAPPMCINTWFSCNDPAAHWVADNTPFGQSCVGGATPATAAPPPAPPPAPPLLPAPPPPPTTGDLTISVSPGSAQVYLDDELKGTASEQGRLVLRGLPARDHTVRLNLAGYKEFAQPVTVAAGEMKEFKAQLLLKPPPGPPQILHIAKGAKFTNKMTTEAGADGVNSRMEMTNEITITDISKAAIK
jgi:hypothetical protein